MTVKRKLKKHSIAFSAYFFMSIFLLITITNVVTLADIVNSKNSIYSNNGVEFNIDRSTGKFTLKELIQEIDISKNELLSINLSNGSNYSTCAILYGDNVDLNIDLVEGRYISWNEFIKNELVAMVSENIKPNIYNRDGEEYIDIIGSEYKVVGIYRSDNEINMNTDIYINMNTAISSMNMSEDVTGYTYKYDAGMHTESNIKNIQKKLSQKYETNLYYSSISKGSDAVLYSLKIHKTLVICLIILLVVVILTLVNIIVYWIENEQLELSIHKLLGASNGEAIALILKKYIAVMGISMSLAFLSFEILKKIGFLELF